MHFVPTYYGYIRLPKRMCKSRRTSFWAIVDALNGALLISVIARAHDVRRKGINNIRIDWGRRDNGKCGDKAS